MSDESPGVMGTLARLMGSGALGVGAVLVALPALLLFVGAHWLAKVEMVGLPLLAIFGIMILFGSLALVSMLFRSLELTDPKQPLALPEGSIRAAIALSLIVLFAIISIMLFQKSQGAPFEVGPLTDAQRNELVLKAPERVVEVVAAPCAASGTLAASATSAASAASAPPAASASSATAGATGAACADADRRYAVRMTAAVSKDMSDLAKQLLILVGTLMTSVTSYYFAARTMSSGGDDSAAGAAPAAAPPSAPTPAPPPGDATMQAESHVDGCEVDIADATPDHELPPARGGVAADARS